jgi:protein involved in temperature-dependent protein secretion
VGQKLLVLDGEEAVPFLEVRELEFAAGETEDAPSASGAVQ